MREVLLLERRARLQGAGSQCHAHSCRFCASLSVRWPGSSHTLPSSSIGGPPGHGVDGRLNVVPATSIYVGRVAEHSRPHTRPARGRAGRARSATTWIAILPLCMLGCPGTYDASRSRGIG
jgi:hypothetical protein